MLSVVASLSNRALDWHHDVWYNDTNQNDNWLKIISWLKDSILESIQYLNRENMFTLVSFYLFLMLFFRVPFC